MRMKSKKWVQRGHAFEQVDASNAVLEKLRFRSVEKKNPINSLINK